MLRKVVFLGMFIGSASAIPSMAIPNLVYANNVQTTSIGNSDSKNNDSTSLQQPNVNPAIITAQVKKQLPGFNADVRGAIISSGQFKVVKMPKQDKIWNGNPQVVLNFVKTNSSTSYASNLTQASKSITNATASNKTSGADMPDYILLGQVVSITQNEDFTPVKYTDKTTNQYNIDIAVDYKLIKTSDKSVMASFTAYAHASDVKILTSSNTVQVQMHNIPRLIQTAAKNLGTDVVNQLNTQFGTSSENYDNGSKVITDLKVYTN